MTATLFYAPLKPIDHPVPSGDRRMARAFFDLLQQIGRQPEVACRLRSYDRAGNEHRQRRIAGLGTRAARLIAQRRPGSLWFTYHAYHKAPDHLGPSVADRLSIPYVVAEASIAGKQARGPWSSGHRATLAGLRKADLVLAMTGRDRTGLETNLCGVPVATFAPFLETRFWAQAPGDRPNARRSLARRHGLPEDVIWLVTVAMMRDDVKARSYALLAEALRALVGDFRHLIVGDGPARANLAKLFDARSAFVGAMPPDAVREVLHAGDLFVWPGLGEAYGMAFLEAMAAGLPVVACAVAGVPEIVRDGVSGLLAPVPNAAGLRDALARLVRAPERMRTLAAAATDIARREHDREPAAVRLAGLLAFAEHHRAELRRAAE